MGIFDFLFGETIKDENKTKPFHENNNDNEKKDWFSRTKPWHKVDEKIINALIKKFGDDPMFELFVITSMEQNLVTKYEQLNKHEFCEGTDLICSLISKIIYDAGSISAKKMITMLQQPQCNTDLLTHHYKIVMDTFETAIILDKNQVSAYYQLAIIKGLLNKTEEATKYAREGLAILQEIRSKDSPFHLSNIGAIKNANQTFEEMEKVLNKIIADFKR